VIPETARDTPRNRRVIFLIFLFLLDFVLMGSIVA
jgi:hypothetical protein